MRIYAPLLCLVISNVVLAQACEIPEVSGENIPGAREYVLGHRIWVKGDGLSNASDSLWVWPSKAGTMCFFFFTMSNNLHYCTLGGELALEKGNTYRYQDAKCRVRLRVSDKSIKATVKSVEYDGAPERNTFCQPEEKWGCGYYTGIGSGRYSFVRANPPVEGTLREEDAQRSSP